MLIGTDFDNPAWFDVDVADAALDEAEMPVVALTFDSEMHFLVTTIFRSR